jgi:hypothetical protein
MLYGLRTVGRLLSGQVLVSRSVMFASLDVSGMHEKLRLKTALCARSGIGRYVFEFRNYQEVLIEPLWRANGPGG